MLLTEARAPARISASGELVRLDEQDRGAWDRALIAEGSALVRERLAVVARGDGRPRPAPDPRRDQRGPHLGARRTRHRLVAGRRPLRPTGGDRPEPDRRPEPGDRGRRARWPRGRARRGRSARRSARRLSRLPRHSRRPAAAPGRLGGRPGGVRPGDRAGRQLRGDRVPHPAPREWVVHPMPWSNTIGSFGGMDVPAFAGVTTIWPAHPERVSSRSNIAKRAIGLYENLPLPAGSALGVVAVLVLDRARPSPAPRPSGAPTGGGRRRVRRGVCAERVGAHRTSPSHRGALQLEQPEAIVTTGPYAFSRHPMYAGWWLIHLGVGALRGTAWVAATVPVAILVEHFGGSVAEERELRDRFGDEYARYAERVPRYAGLAEALGRSRGELTGRPGGVATLNARIPRHDRFRRTGRPRHPSVNPLTRRQLLLRGDLRAVGVVDQGSRRATRRPSRAGADHRDERDNPRRGAR